MSSKEKQGLKNLDGSEEENESGACGGNEPPMSLSAAEAILGSYLDESVDNLSMEVHLGDDNSRHPSEISSISYQNLLDDGEPSNSIRSRRGSDDSVESYPPDFPDSELPPDDMETFEACDLPLSDHFPMGSVQRSDSYKTRPLSSSENVFSSRPNVKLKESDNVRMREKSKASTHSNSTSKISDETSSKKRNSLEVRNNIPTVGEVKDYDKQPNLDVNKIASAKPKMIGLKQSPGLARRVDNDSNDVSSNNYSDNSPKVPGEEQLDSSLPVSSSKVLVQKPKSKTNASKNCDGSSIEVITPIPKNMNIENEYDYVKYARVQQGNSYVGMRLAYSSSNDSLNIKNVGGSMNSSRETSPEKVLQQKILSDIGQNRVTEESLTEIPLNNSDYSEDKKAFTLSPENTECDSVEVESVTSEGENSPAGFPTVEDGLSSSQASDAEEGGGLHCLALDRSPSKVLQNKQKTCVNQQMQDEEIQGPPEMDAQAIMEDLKMKREALDMAIADIKSAIQRSKSMSLETSYNPEGDNEEMPVWIKRDNQGSSSKRQEETSKGGDALDSHQGSNTGKATQERDEVNSSIEHTVSSVEFDDASELKHCQENELNNNSIQRVISIENISQSECTIDSELNVSGTRTDGLNSVVKPSQDTRKYDEVNSAIASVSSEIIQTLGCVKNCQANVENVPEAIITEERLQSNMTSQKGDLQSLDIQEFDSLSTQLEMKAKNITISDDETMASEQKNRHNTHSSENIGVHVNEDTDDGSGRLGADNWEMGQDAKECDNIVNEKQTQDNDRDGNEGSGYENDNDGAIVEDGRPIGYDSDDECEDADGIRYTRRNKGKKYAPLQKDDSLEFGGGFGGGASGRRKEVPIATHANGHTVSHSSKNGSVCNNRNTSIDYEEHHLHRSDPTLSSEESSDIDAHIRSYTRPPNADSDTDEETDRLLHKQYQERDKNVEIPELYNASKLEGSMERDRQYSKAKEAAIRDPDRPEVLIEGVLFRARYLGSTQLISEGQPSKAMRMMQAQEAVGRIKAPDGENQPSTDVDLFVSTEKIMVLNTDLQEIMMDHSLRTISYIADIGDILVIMARRRLITSPDDILGRRRRQAKILCHVFESVEAQLIAQSIGQAFQVAYMEFLKANGIEDPGLLKEMDYQDVLNQQEIYGEELNLFANKDFHKEVIVPKAKNEPLGIVIVESGWGSMVPTVVLANMMPTGPAARCGQLNIGDQIISINGVSLVGLLLSACQTYIKASRTQTVVKLTVVPCPPVVEVLIKRPDVKYQLGFSVQNGVICSLLRGGIAERGGVRVGHRIIEINNQSVVAVPHEKIVTLLASSVGEIHMKTMPTSIFRLLTGQDVPHYL